MQNNVPFYDGDRLCMGSGTLLNTGELVTVIRWQGREIPTVETMETLASDVRKALPGATVRMIPAVDAGVNVVIDDGGVVKTTNMYALTNAYLGGPVGKRRDALRRFVRQLVGYTD